jgi:LSD1 subclass zinc finger protein
LEGDHRTRFDQAGDTRHGISQAARDLVEFREWNLTDSAWPSKAFRCGFCRNVLMYLRPATATLC